jgi:hypothetical protein
LPVHVRIKQGEVASLSKAALTSQSHEKFPCSHPVFGVIPVCDAVVDEAAERDRLGGLSLISPQARQIDGRVQFPELFTLSLRGFEGADNSFSSIICTVSSMGALLPNGELKLSGYRFK